MNEPLIENGFAVTGAGVWLIGRGQPAAACGKFTVKGLKGFIVPDRRFVYALESEDEAYLSSSERPFLTHITSVDALSIVSSKLLVAPSTARKGAKLLRVIPMSFREAIPVTRFGTGWAVLATASRVKRIVLKEDQVLCVKHGSVVAWTGKDPVGVAGRVKLRDLFIPKRKVSLSLDFYGPQVVWVEGSDGV
jgi:uncharacterized protein (AIM24 family)